VRILAIEACTPKDRGSIGFNYVLQSARRAGFDVRVDYDANHRCDIELVSVHHCSDFPGLARLPRRGAMRIIGGHAVIVNPRPAIRHSDVVCIGEAEQWIVDALRRLSQNTTAQALADMPSAIISEDWNDGDELPDRFFEKQVPRNEPHLNVANEGHSATWYIELSRGCPFKCHYCELGNIAPYRIQSTDWIIEQLRKLDMIKSKRVSLFAPDEASHPGYAAILAEIDRLGLTTMFGSMRADQVLKRGIKTRANMLIRVGMDGLTEETRFRVGRKQTDDDFVDFFKFLTDRGHVSFKIFMIVGYPWEVSSDADKWFDMLRRIGEIERKTNAHVRIKITPLIPQPCTPLADAKPRYDFAMIKKIETFIANWRPRKKTGWFLKQDGHVMNFKRWRTECTLAQGREDIV